jgi:hypothetical protein
MPRLKRAAAQTATRAVLRHSVHGVAAKLRRRPLRSATLLGAGVGVGVLGGWMAGRRRAALPS